MRLSIEVFEGSRSTFANKNVAIEFHTPLRLHLRLCCKLADSTRGHASTRLVLGQIADGPPLPHPDVFRMKLGLGLYRHMLTRENFQFARQAGATHLVVHLVDYFRSSSNSTSDQPLDDDCGWGPAGDPDQLWTMEELTSLRREINAVGLELEAIENFDPAHWY